MPRLLHAIDCSIHDPNAEPPGICDCGALDKEVIAALLESLRNMVGLAKMRGGHLHEYGAAIKDAEEAIAKAEGARKEAEL